MREQALCHLGGHARLVGPEPARGRPQGTATRQQAHRFGRSADQAGLLPGIATPDWSGSCPSASGPWVAVYTPYHNQGGGRNSSPSCLYYTSVRLHSAQPVKKIVLPDLTPPVPQSGDPSLHIFAATIY
ncbi:MAG TPA: hypothetical protein VK586_13475 [Streptosporangiaceae bacterium]|nr:hypothetical protein [Streptosporangiaceae bacterium]